MQKTIFVVDDSLVNLSLAEEALEKHYHVITLSSAAKVYSALKDITPDLILLDVAMPEMSGFDTMKQLKRHKTYSKIPVIFLTALTDSFNEALGIELGAVDFISKPFSPPVLLNRVKNHIQIDEIIRQRTEQILMLKDDIIFAMADTIERRDIKADGHVERTTIYLKILLDATIAHGVYVDELQKWESEVLVSSASLHDVGTIYIPASILNKPGPLTDEEFETVKTHAIEGEKIIDQMISRTGNAEFLQSAKLITASHHERWDGTGYPHRLKGTEIPLHGRLVAIVDVYDALTSDRPYRKAFTHEVAVEMIKDDAGKHFDPLITGVFGEISNLFQKAKIDFAALGDVGNDGRGRKLNYSVP